MNCTGLGKQRNLKFLTLWQSFLQNKESKLSTFLGHPIEQVLASCITGLQYLQRKGDAQYIQ